jgi:hypothetical protein
MRPPLSQGCEVAQRILSLAFSFDVTPLEALSNKELNRSELTTRWTA